MNETSRSQNIETETVSGPYGSSASTPILAMRPPSLSGDGDDDVLLCIATKAGEARARQHQGRLAVAVPGDVWRRRASALCAWRKAHSRVRRRDLFTHRFSWGMLRCTRRTDQIKSDKSREDQIRSDQIRSDRSGSDQIRSDQIR